MLSICEDDCGVIRWRFLILRFHQLIKTILDESCCYLDKPKDKEFILNTWWDDNAGLEGYRFSNVFVLAVFGNHLLTYKIEKDILEVWFKVVCYAYDDVGNMYKQLFISEHDLPNAFIRHHTKYWSDWMIFFLKVDVQPQQESLGERITMMKTTMTTEML